MTRQDVAAERKAKIVKATVECITQFGYNNFSMQDVAKAADVSKGIIHYYFLNKEDLMMAVLDYVSSEVEGLLIGTEVNADPVARLSNVVWMIADVAQTKREYYKINIDFWTQIDQKENVRKEIAKHYAKFRNAIAGILQQGMAHGVFRKGNPSYFASIVIGMIDGIALQWLFDKSIFNYDDIVKHCEEAIMTFLKVS